MFVCILKNALAADNPLGVGCTGIIVVQIIIGPTNSTIRTGTSPTTRDIMFHIKAIVCLRNLLDSSHYYYIQANSQLFGDLINGSKVLLQHNLQVHDNIYSGLATPILHAMCQTETDRLREHIIKYNREVKSLRTMR